MSCPFYTFPGPKSMETQKSYPRHFFWVLAYAFGIVTSCRIAVKLVNRKETRPTVGRT